MCLPDHPEHEHQETRRDHQGRQEHEEGEGLPHLAHLEEQGRDEAHHEGQHEQPKEVEADAQDVADHESGTFSSMRET